MDAREDIGQLFMLGFMGTSMSADLADFMKEYRPGGLIVFKRNLESIEQIVALTNDLQQHSESPVLLAIDQEGGRVSRLPAGFTIFPSCAVLGRCGTTELAYAAAAATALELRAVGLNMNMAPVLDLNTNSNNPIIGDRAFSADPTQVCELGLAAMAGLHDNQIIACGKHFPGHGDTDVDSHLKLPVVRASAERMRGRELRPFRHAIDNGLATVMTAHVLYPSFDADFPATLSPAILTNLLRDEVRFHGVIMTDDLEMRAIIDHYGIEEATVLAFQAGADMLLICKEQDLEVAAMEGLSRAVRNGMISTARIDASLRRIAHLKARFIPSYTPVDPMAAKRVVGNRAHRTLLDTIRRTGIQA